MKHGRVPGPHLISMRPIWYYYLSANRDAPSIAAASRSPSELCLEQILRFSQRYYLDDVEPGNA